MLETVVLSFIVFSIVFVFPFAFSCQKCAYGMDCYAGYSSSYANGSVTASASGRRLAGGGATLTFVQWNCDTYHYNPMATLLHSGQEGLIKHLLERSNAVSGDASLDWSVMLPFLCLYIVLAIGIFGIFVPSGNFIPAMTIGAGLGRLFGLLVASWFRTSFPAEVIDVGLYGLIGAAAMLAGVTRMTITIAVILVEITDDAMSVLPMMLVVTCAKFTADLLSPSFDHAMIHLNKLPFLDEEPPREYDVLCARDVMTRKVIILREKERVRDLLAVLQRTSHNGFPIVGGGSNDAEARAPGDSGQRATEPGAAFFAGLILRRQLLVLLSERVWSEQVPSPRSDGLEPEQPHAPCHLSLHVLVSTAPDGQPRLAPDFRPPDGPMARLALAGHRRLPARGRRSQQVRRLGRRLGGLRAVVASDPRVRAGRTHRPTAVHGPVTICRHRADAAAPRLQTLQ